MLLAGLVRICLSEDSVGVKSLECEIGVSMKSLMTHFSVTSEGQAANHDITKLGTAPMTLCKYMGISLTDLWCMDEDLFLQHHMSKPVIYLKSLTVKRCT